MRFPRNIILNTTSPLNVNSNEYWANAYISNLQSYQTSLLFLINLNFFFNNFKTNLISNRVKALNTPHFIVKDCSWDFFTIFFLRKERMYTKLKYSRVTQFDISSGAVAALFAGFIGFLISEKFGFELVDSGDFYFFFMYIVFLLFSVKLLLRINDTRYNYSVFSFKWFFLFFYNLFLLILNKFIIFVFLSIPLNGIKW